MNNPRPYELEGRFFPAKVDGRRHLVFQRHDGIIGASPAFSRSEAYRNARPNPVPPSGTLESTFVGVLRAHGFIVRKGEMSDALGEAVERMLFPA